MSLSTTPAPARTDVRRDRGEHRAAEYRPLSSRAVRAAGTAVATGSALWAGSLLAFGANPAGGWQATAYNVSSLLFQLGLVGLVSVQLRTGATGTGRLARFFLHAEHVLLGLAIVSTLAWIIAFDQREAGWSLLLDVFWPLSMLGMAAIGIRIAIAGRWRGAARVWPLIAESWAPVVVPLNAVLGATVGGIAGAAHLLVGYVALGIVLAASPQLTGARD
ncbi:hypothetical protein [Modestobacter marinus]|uniref:hypothetical protein n=1 Tax=Modestobacter marinus TaxID=477641 RepID=UPI001C965DE8|nr:hypothetical protein [Modestobacter marinus]